MPLPVANQVLFNPGPVNLHPEIKENLFNVELCHRQPEFEELDARVRDKLHAAAVLSAESHALALLHGSGTLAVDAALSSLVRGRTMVVRNGVYGDRFAETLDGLPEAVLVDYDIGWGEPLRVDELAAQLDAERPDWLAVVHHETSTGLLNPLAPVVRAAQQKGVRVFVDAVSSMGAHALGCDPDVVCFNSGKCLESLPGIAGVFWSRDLESRAAVPVIDVGRHSQGIPSTPNVQAFIALDIALDLLSAEDRPARYRRLSRTVWAAGGAHFELFLPEEHRSHVLTAFRLDGHTFEDLFERALARGYVIYAGQGELRDEIFRVANMGAAIDEQAIHDLFRVIGE